MSLLSPMIFRESDEFWELWHRADKPYMWISDEKRLKKFINEVADTFITSWNYRRADIHDYEIMCKLTRMNITPKAKIIAVEIMK